MEIEPIITAGKMDGPGCGDRQSTLLIGAKGLISVNEFMDCPSLTRNLPSGWHLQMS